MQLKFFSKDLFRWTNSINSISSTRQKSHQPANKITRTKIRWQTIGLAISLPLTTIFGSFVHTPSVSATGCDDVQFIFARGSGEHLEDVSFRAWQSSIEAAIDGMELKTSFYELGAKNIMGYKYPAASVGDDFWGYINLATAFFSGGTAFAFGESVDQGMSELKNYLRLMSSACPKTKYVLGGYSQGALVVNQSLNEINANKIVYIANFGDPKIYLPEGSNDLLDRYRTPDACRGINLSSYRAYVPDCRAYRGTIGAVIPYEPEEYAGKIGTWCNDFDALCSSGMSVEDHVSYVSKNLYGDAASMIRRKLLKAFPDKAGTQAPRYSLHDLVFLFDATSSMEYMLDRYKEEAQKLAEKILASGGRVALYEYRDLQDEVPVKQLCDFDCNQEEFEQKLADITPSGGGDDCESLLSAAYIAMNELNWNFGSTKSLFVLTDAPYHSPDRDGTTEAAVVQKSLELDPVNIYVMTKNYTNVQYFKGLTEKTYGKAFDIYREVELSTQIVYERPVAQLAAMFYEGKIGDTLTFDASSSYSYESDELRFDWDLDGDGKFEFQNVGPVISRQYNQAFSKYIAVKVTAGNKSGTMSAKVKIGTQPVVAESSITKLGVEELENNSIKVTFETDAEKVLVFGNSAPLGFIDATESPSNFTVSDVTQDLELILVPYRDNQRGLARTLEIKLEDDTYNFEDFAGTPDTILSENKVTEPDSEETIDPLPEKPNLNPDDNMRTDPDADFDPNLPVAAPSFSYGGNYQDDTETPIPDFVIPTAPDTGVKLISASRKTSA